MTPPNYEVGFPSPRAEKEFYSQERILEWFGRLAEDPRPPGKNFKFLKGELQVYQFLAQYRIREGDWRILYDIDDKNRRVILLALRRRGHHAYD